MTAFLIKSTLSMGLFLLFYKLVLEREKMHRINRVLLLFALVFSMIVPFLSFELISENPVITGIPSYMLPEIYITNHQTATPVNRFAIKNMLWIIYGLGFLVFLIRFVRNITLLRGQNSQKRKNQKRRLYFGSAG